MSQTPPLPAEVVQRQLDAYNDRDLTRFLAEYADDVELFRPPESAPVILGKTAMAEHYRTKRFNLPALHADLVQRIVIGNKVIDHERIFGIEDQAVDAAVVFQVADGLIRRVWFFNSN
jgi:hypothetical protein